MSSLKNPVGPEEPSVYWRRRAIVGVGLVVALLILWWLFSAVFGSDAGAPQASSDTVSSAPSGAAAATSGPSAVATPAPSATTSTQAASSTKAAPSTQAQAATKPPRCQDAVVAVVVKPAATSAAVGAGMKLTMTVTNTGSATCRRDVSQASNELRIVSGPVLVWSSDYCKGTADGEASKDATVTLKPDESWSTAVTWPGKVTTATCPADQPTAKAGTYRALGDNGKQRSAEAVFTLG